MVLIIIALVSLIVALIRGGSFSNIFKGEIRASFLFIISLLLFIAVKVGNTAQISIITDYTYYMLLVSYCLLLFASLINLNNISMGLLLVGTLMNFVVIFVNGGKMPVAAEILSIVGFTEDFVNQSATMMVANSGTYLSFLGGIIPIPLPSVFAEIISPGTIILSCGLFGSIQNALIEYEYYDDDDEEDDDDDEETDDDFTKYAEDGEEVKLDKKALKQLKKDQKKEAKLAKKNRKNQEEDFESENDEEINEPDDDDEIDIFAGKKNYTEEKVDTDEFNFDFNNSGVDLNDYKDESDINGRLFDDEDTEKIDAHTLDNNTEVNDLVDTQIPTLDSLNPFEEDDFVFAQLNVKDEHSSSDADETIEPQVQTEMFDSVIAEDDITKEFIQVESNADETLTEPVETPSVHEDFYENTQAFFDELGDSEQLFADLSSIPELSFDENKEEVNYEKYFEREDSDIIEEPKTPQVEVRNIVDDLIVELDDSDFIQEAEPETTGIEFNSEEFDLDNIPELEQKELPSDGLTEPTSKAHEFDLKIKGEEPIEKVEDEIEIEATTELEQSFEAEKIQSNGKEESEKLDQYISFLKEEESTADETVNEENLAEQTNNNDNTLIVEPHDIEEQIEVIEKQEYSEPKTVTRQVPLEKETEIEPEQPLVKEELIDTDSPFIIKDGRFVENPYYKFRKSNVPRDNNDTESTGVNTFVLKTRNPSISGRPSFSPTTKPSDYRDPKDKSEEKFEKIDMKIGNVQIKIPKKNNDK